MSETAKSESNPWQIGSDALRNLTEMKIPPLPPYYEVWFSHIENPDSDLTQEIEQEIMTQKEVNEAFLQEAHAKHFSVDGSPENLQYIASKVLKETEAIQKLALGVGDSAKELTADVDQASSNFENSNSEAIKEKELIGALMNAAKSAADRNRNLESELSIASAKISTLQKSVQKVANDAETDFLTGLKNRRHFDRTLSMFASNAEATNEKLCLIVTDIDHFKKFNDTWGHQTGDQVLRLVSEVLRDNVKGRDLLARYGGEEFAVALPNTSMADAIKLADTIRVAVSKRKLINKTTREDLGHVTMSCGVAEIRPNSSPSALFADADAALYKAKETGRNRVVGHQPE